MRVAIVVSRFNDFVTERLLDGARAALADLGIGPGDIEVVQVPGAFEIPMAAQHVAEAGDDGGAGSGTRFDKIREDAKTRRESGTPDLTKGGGLLDRMGVAKPA